MFKRQIETYNTTHIVCDRFDFSSIHLLTHIHKSLRLMLGNLMSIFLLTNSLNSFYWFSISHNNSNNNEINLPNILWSNLHNHKLCCTGGFNRFSLSIHTAVINCFFQYLALSLFFSLSLSSLCSPLKKTTNLTR